MKLVRTILLAVGLLAVALVALGAFLPSAYEVRRSIEVAAPMQRVYALVAEPRKWSEWSVWNRRDPAMEIAYAGPPAGAGARWSWKSRTEGTGAMEFTRTEQDRLVEYALSFPEFGMRSTGTLLLEPTTAGTKVTWTNQGDVGRNPIKRYLAVVMDRLVGPDFEGGLANLKTLAEKP
jgi:uncharacterized protein YndB with AHSA1/START domain